MRVTLNPKTQRLINLMAQHNVGIPDVSALVNRSEKTVRMWRSKNEPSIPDELLELLELKLSQRAGEKVA
ncbi:hypothetical protein NAV33_07370 [Pseudomonas stutzeri]|uniref:hypothetical protein n=1 Tax=Stutzerimonas stutzeri TaxID=316 RepID=UPI00210B6A47|nr:hypothetical protein [Stutzerimonas stutzeri]MCQ4311714.1 hypothetical protein [Stutzerimonas stutzeri]